jgi:glycosyltransferase involved in cell wall biosynthesis
MVVPKVSVIVPSYNHARYLRRRIDSILGQTFGDLELLILDDASTDDSLRVLLSYAGKPRVRLQVNPTNTGSAFRQWQKGISLARGEYIWIAESDDAAEPGFLERLVEVLDANPNVGLVYCQSQLIDTEDRAVGTSLDWTNDLDPCRWSAPFMNSGVDEVRNFLLRKNTIPNASAVLSRRAAVREACPLDTSFKLCGDWLHWGRVLTKSDVAYVAEPLNHWRLQSSNSRTHPPGYLEWQEGQRVIRQLAQAVGVNETAAQSLTLAFAERCINWLAAATAPRKGSAAKTCS